MKHIKHYISYNKWTGQIYIVSKQKFVSEHPIVYLESYLIDDINLDRISLGDVFIHNNEIHRKEGKIYFEKSEDNFIDIPEFAEEMPFDIKLDLYQKNKLLDISINIRSLKTWYNHRMKDQFEFNTHDDLEFIIDFDIDITEISVPIDSFLETFKTTIDLSAITSFDNIKIKTKRILPNYAFEIHDKKYHNIEDKTNALFQKINQNNDIIKHNNHYDIILNIDKNDVLKVTNNIKNPNSVFVFGDIQIYVTGKDNNYIYQEIFIPLDKIWKNKTFNINVKDIDLKNKQLYCNNKNVKILFKR